jgi:peptide/nickel transport system substrate-binding protein
VQRRFRQAISHAVDREAFAQTVFLGEAVPVWGPVTPGNRLWFSPNLPRYPYDLGKAHALLKGIGLEDRNGNGVVEDQAGTEARFTVITQQGLGYYERGTTVLREQAAMIGVALDVVPLEFGAMYTRLMACDYDAIYMRPIATDLDPAGNMDFWLSSGAAHLWNMEQKAPATEWERRIDALMREQAATLDEARRRELFNQVQRVFAENVPALYFAAPRLYYAHSRRVRGVVPSVMRPPVPGTPTAPALRATRADTGFFSAVCSIVLVVTASSSSPSGAACARGRDGATRALRPARRGREDARVSI